MDSVRFIVSYYKYTEGVILYKIPDGVSLKQWIENEVSKERKVFETELAAVG